MDEFPAVVDVIELVNDEIIFFVWTNDRVTIRNLGVWRRAPCRETLCGIRFIVEDFIEPPIQVSRVAYIAQAFANSKGKS